MFCQTGPDIQKEELATTKMEVVNGDPTPAGKIEQPDLDEFNGHLDELQAG